MAIASPMQFPAIEGLVRKGGLEAEISATLGLDSIFVIKFDSTSTSEDAREVVGNALAFKEAALETSTPPVS